MEDTDLLERWAQGCQVAGGDLLRRHGPPLRRFFASKAPEAAEDLAQATLLALLEKRTEVRERNSVRSYLFGIARHQLYQHFRAAKQHRRGLRFNTTSLMARGHSPSALVERGDDDAALMRAVATLPMEMRILLELVYWEELSPTDAAHVFGVAENTIHSRLHRAKQKLRLALSEIEDRVTIQGPIS